MKPSVNTLAHRTVCRKQGGSWRPSWGIFLSLLLIGFAMALWLWRDDPSEVPSLASGKAGSPAATQNSPWNVMAMFGQDASSSDQKPVASTSGRDGQDPSLDLSHYVPAGQIPSMSQVIDKLHEAGIFTGLGAFNPPGTNPPLTGLAVPENFPLPAGYVRHYQATDDGQSIEPILMFAPDQVIYDANHQAIAIPEDRVVPPELVPPGFPIRRIVIPPPRDNPA